MHGNLVRRKMLFIVVETAIIRSISLMAKRALLTRVIPPALFLSPASYVVFQRFHRTRAKNQEMLTDVAILYSNRANLDLGQPSSWLILKNIRRIFILYYPTQSAPIHSFPRWNRKTCHYFSFFIVHVRVKKLRNKREDFEIKPLAKYARHAYPVNSHHLL